MSKLIDLTGKKFYELTVISKATPDKQGRTRWNCVCSCGKHVIASGYDLRNGKHRSCGHTRNIRACDDLTGKQFGELEVIGKNDDGTWKCKCSCGNYINARKSDLISGHTKGCGHSRRFIDLTGKQFGEWTVIKYLGDSFWECKCSCGNVSKVHSYALRNGKTLSCGHNTESKKLADLTGKQFNDWTVLEYVGGRHSLWKCKCSCGTIKNIAAYDLKNGNSRNCGHNRKLPKEDLTGMTFGQLKVIDYVGKGMYKCQCSCGTVKNILGSNLKSGETIGCGCQQKRTIYTKEFFESLLLRYKAEHGEKPFVADIADMIGITSYYVSSLITKYELRDMVHNNYSSRGEKEVFDFVQSLMGEDTVISRDRKLLLGKELDVYIPSKNIAIEYNGNYWHREEAVGKSGHLNKTVQASRSGVRLIHIFEYEWNDIDTCEKIKSLIKSALNSNKNVYYARNCYIKTVDIDEERAFLDLYHLQNYSPSKIAYGIYNNDELLSIMSFGKPRFNSNYEWEIIRYCNKFDTTIVGGAEKLFKNFCEQNKPQSILTYTDIAKFTGNVYRKLGFILEKGNITPPNYVWCRGDKVLTRYQTQKQRLIENGLDVYGETEDTIMGNLGYEKIYDCGNLKYTWYKR